MFPFRGAAVGSHQGTVSRSGVPETTTTSSGRGYGRHFQQSFELHQYTRLMVRKNSLIDKAQGDLYRPLPRMYGLMVPNVIASFVGHPASTPQCGIALPLQDDMLQDPNETVLALEAPIAQIRSSLLLHSTRYKPARYLGGELSVQKDHEVDVTICLAFPDLYDLGMSHLGRNSIQGIH